MNIEDAPITREEKIEQITLMTNFANDMLESSGGGRTEQVDVELIDKTDEFHHEQMESGNPMFGMLDMTDKSIYMNMWLQSYNYIRTRQDL